MHTATTEIYTLSLHDALPISDIARDKPFVPGFQSFQCFIGMYFSRSHKFLTINCNAIISKIILDRKSTRLNSSHVRISYAVFCLKKKKKLKYLIQRIIP